MAEVKTRTDLLSMCRVCMENGSKMVPIYTKLEDVYIAQIITEFTAVQISRCDGFPANVCEPCVEEMRVFIRFIGKARQSDREIRRLFHSAVKFEIAGLEAQDATEEELQELITKSDELAVKIEEDAEYLMEDNGQEDDFDQQATSDNEKHSNYEITDATAVSTKNETGTESALHEPTFDTTNFDVLDSVEQEIFIAIDVTDRLFCCICLIFCKTLDELKEHTNSVHTAKRRTQSNKKYVCQFCSGRYISQSALETHQLKMKFIKIIYECRKCQQRFLAGLKRRKHAHEHPASGDRTSSHRKSKPSSVNMLEASIKICCAKTCHEKFDTMDQLMEHSASVHRANKVQSMMDASSERPVECPICYKRFTGQLALQGHYQRIYQAKRHVCSVCGLNFNKKSDCSRHESEHRGERLFNCELCTKVFACKYRLKAHVLTHSARKSFVCDVCGKSFVQKHTLQAHALVHEGKLPFECEICKKAFRVKLKLVYHMRTHTGEKPYPCRYCDAAFTEGTNRQRHEIVHTGIYPYHCNYCGKGFSIKRFKVEHERNCNESSCFQCPHCPQMCSTSTEFTLHMRLHVPGPDSDVHLED